MSERKARQRRQEMRAAGIKETGPGLNPTEGPNRELRRRKYRGGSTSEAPSPKPPAGRTPKLPESVRLREWSKKSKEQRERVPEAARPRGTMKKEGEAA